MNGGDAFHEGYPYNFNWIVAFVVAVLLLPVVNSSPSFPGDVAIERWVQSALPSDLEWAEQISGTGEFPSILFLLAVALVLSWSIAGPRAILLCLVSFGGMMAAGHWLWPLVTRPGAPAEAGGLIKSITEQTFPSLFALRYAALFGFLGILAIKTTTGALRVFILIPCILLLSLGWLARIALGAHWPSDVAISYYLGFLWAAFLVRFGLPVRERAGLTG